jgi:hypothetical protein
MPISIPKSVFDKYKEIIDSTINDIFGVTCQLVFIEKIEVIDNSFNNIPDNRSVNPHRRNNGDFRRNDKVIKEVEKLQDIKMKVYWERKSWLKIGGNIVIPDNAIQTIFLSKDLDKVLRAKELIVHKEINDDLELRFQKWGEPFPVGFHKERHWCMFWERN